MTESILSKNPELRTTLEVFGDSLERESNNLKKGRKRVGDENSIAMVKENEQKRLRGEYSLRCCSSPASEQNLTNSLLSWTFLEQLR